MIHIECHSTDNCPIYKTGKCRKCGARFEDITPKTIAGRLEMMEALFLPQVDEDGVVHQAMFELTKEQYIELLSL